MRKTKHAGLLNKCVFINRPNVSLAGTSGFNRRPMGILWEVLHLKPSVNCYFQLLWHFQRGVITQDTPISGPDLYQKETVTGIVLGLSHVYYCLCVKRPQGASDACWHSNIEQKWETDHGLLKVGWGVGGKEGSRIYSWFNFIHSLQHTTTNNTEH